MGCVAGSGKSVLKIGGRFASVIGGRWTWLDMD